MVPHRKILRIIAILAHCSLDPEGEREKLEDICHVKFPKDVLGFWTTEVLSWLTPEVESLLLTTDFNAVGSYEVAFMAAAQLEISKYITIGPDGLEINLAHHIKKWRKNEQMRICIETLLLCGISVEQVTADLRRMYQIQVTEDDISEFAALFIDNEFIEGDSWLDYQECIGTTESLFKMKMMQAPKDYARYKLGVPVHLNDEEVIDRLMSDSYFVNVEMSVEGQTTTAADIARIKLERDTIFKAMDRRVKIRVAKLNEGDGGATAAAKAIAKIVLKYTEQEIPLMSEVPGLSADQEKPPTPAPIEAALPAVKK